MKLGAPRGVKSIWPDRVWNIVGPVSLPGSVIIIGTAGACSRQLHSSQAASQDTNDTK